MYNFLVLNVKCPLCRASLMDEDQFVDNDASIKVNISIGNKKGVINLSSIYASYNYTSDIEILPDEVAELSCPHCKKVIKSNVECKICKSQMIPFTLDLGGTVSICSRVGCKSHTVEFDDLEEALKKIEKEYWFLSSTERAELFKEPKEMQSKDSEEQKEILKTGAFLSAYCPECKKSLLDSNMLKLKIVNDKNQTGYVMLSPYLNVFTTRSSIFLAEGKPAGDLKCFHCDTSLMIEEKKCDECGSHVAKISISARSKLIDFYICSKKGCRWHGLSAADMNDIRLEDSLAY